LYPSPDATKVAAAARVGDESGAQLQEPETSWPEEPSGSAKVAQRTERFHVLHEIFEMQADARPDAVAVEFGREETTYADLEARANRLARHLRARGVQRGSLVAMLLPRSADAYAALLGILKAGAAYVALDPEYPADRVAYILENC